MRIPLRPEFLPMVRSGAKRSTVRAGIREVKFGPGMFDAGDETLPVEIRAVRYKTYGALTERDAALDGFDSLEALRGTLKRFYPDLTADAPVSVIYIEPQGAGRAPGEGDQDERDGERLHFG